MSGAAVQISGLIRLTALKVRDMMTLGTSAVPLRHPQLLLHRPPLWLVPVLRLLHLVRPRLVFLATVTNISCTTQMVGLSLLFSFLPDKLTSGRGLLPRYCDWKWNHFGWTLWMESSSQWWLQWTMAELCILRRCSIFYTSPDHSICDHNKLGFKHDHHICCLVLRDCDSPRSNPNWNPPYL